MTTLNDEDIMYQWHQDADVVQAKNPSNFRVSIKPVLEEIVEFSSSLGSIYLNILKAELFKTIEIIERKQQTLSELEEPIENQYAELCDIFVTLSGLKYRLGFSQDIFKNMYTKICENNYKKLISAIDTVTHPDDISIWCDNYTKETGLECDLILNSEGTYYVFLNVEGKILKGCNYSKPNLNAIYSSALLEIDRKKSRFNSES